MSDTTLGSVQPKARVGKKSSGLRFTMKAAKRTPIQFNKNNMIKGGAKQERLLQQLIREWNTEHTDKKIKLRDGKYNYDDTQVIKNQIIPAYNRSIESS